MKERNFVQSLGAWFLARAERTGTATLLLWQIVCGMPAALIRFQLVARQIYSVGVLSLIIIVVSGLFVGMVLALQGYNSLVDFGAEGSLSVVVALTLSRELGPVVAGLVFAGRAGSALTAEIGLMKSTEQLSGLEMMAVDPVPRILAPRLLAGIISLPLLTALFTAVGILGAYVIGVEMLGIDGGSFWSLMEQKVDWYGDIINGLIKALVFGFIVTWIAVFEGYDTIPTAEGIGAATTRTVVNGSLSILGLDFILTAFMYT